MPDTLNSAVRILREELSGIVAIYRFGSFGSANQRSDSDLDLAVLTQTPIDNIKRWNVAEAIASCINRDVDLIDLIQANPPIRIQVIGEGERIFCANEVQANLFEINSMSQYQHLNEERKEVMEAFLSTVAPQGIHKNG